MKKNKFVCQDLPNKKMDLVTFTLRKKVMEYVRDAKILYPELPRIEVRITENHIRTLAMGQYFKNIIWISERAINNSNFDSRTIVFHEILHSVFGFIHDETCPLMKSIHTPLKKEQAQKLFLKWIKQHNIHDRSIAS